MDSMGRASAWIILLAGLFAPLIGRCANQRSYTVGVMTRVQQVGAAQFGPRGRRLLMEEIAGYDTARNFGWFPWSSFRSTLLRADLSGRSGMSSAHGTALAAIASKAGASDVHVWLRGFSPDGAEAAVGWLDGDVPRAGVYDFASGRLREFHYRIAPVYCSLNCPYWISDSRYIDYTLPRDAQEEELSRAEYDHKLIDRWDRETWKGRETAAKVYCSGGACENRGVEEGAGKWIIVDARTGQRRLLGTGMWRDLSLSPNRRQIAVVRSTGALDVGRLRIAGVLGANRILRLVVYSLASEGPPVDPCLACNVTAGSLRWSPDGSKLFFDSRIIRDGRERHRQFIYDFHRGRLERFAPAALHFHVAIDTGTAAYRVPFVWLNDDTAAVRVKRARGTPSLTRSEARANDTPLQYDWYAVSPGGASVNLTAGLERSAHSDSLADFIAVHRGKLLMMAGRDLWELSRDGRRRDLTGGIPEELVPWCSVLADWRAAGIAPVCSGVSRPSLATFSAQKAPDRQALARGWLTFRIAERGVTTANVLFLNVDNGKHVRLAAPGPHARLIAASALAKAALYDLEGPTGDKAVLVRSGQPATELWNFNRELANVIGGTPVMLVHRDPGEESDRIDWLLLPPGYRAGDREPLLLYFYPGEQYSRSWDAGHLLREVSMLNMEIPAAHGYAVLLASTRMPPMGKPDNPCSGMHRQLIDAAENAVAKGYADPDRWALMGHSYGGYGVYCVVAHTDRFRAAIALDGPANLTSAYGDGGFPDAAGSGADLAVATIWAEGNQGRMGAPPWVAPVRYIHNSPLFLVDRIHTPLLIFQGNDDQTVSVIEAEQMFNALHRLGRAAEFVRYWGEGHIYQSPANIRDMWHRIFGWLDRYLHVERKRQSHVESVGP